MTRWGMVVDLARCVGCQTCTIACKTENGLPPGTLWRTVLDLESGEFPDVQRQFFPLTCMHCADPPCHDACPTTATKVRQDGIVWIDDDLCIGCGSCVVACPYKARHLIPKERYYFGEATAPELATYDRGRVGICTKCHFCFHKYDDAPDGVRPGVDPEYTPSCVSSCIADVIQFGDFEDPQSKVSRMVAAHPQPTRMLEHLGTRPSVVHLNARPIEPRPPERQQTWHGLAVSNFFCGTTGVGLYALATVAGWLQGPIAPLLGDDPLLAWADPARLEVTARHSAALLAPLLVAIGLLSVGAEAGRPLRGFNVLRNLRRSWMSRESALAMVFMVLAFVDTLFWQQPVAQGVAVLAGLGVVLAQGLILSKAKGVPAWNVPIMPLHFLISALLFGAGALFLLQGLHGMPAMQPSAWPMLGVVLIATNLAVWWRYLSTPPRTETFRHSVAVLRAPATMSIIVGAGHLLPALLLLLSAFYPAAQLLTLSLAGVSILAGGLYTRYALLRKAAFWVDLFERFGAAPVPQTMPADRAA